jgi:tetratricopeptide (TPR) repeat protein
VHLRRRDYDAAERYLNRVLELESDSPAYIYRALLILARDGDLRAASDALREGIPRAGAEDIAFWALQFDFGSALWRSQDSAAQVAAERLSMAPFGPDSAAYYLSKARLRRSRADTKLARVYFDSAAKILESGARARPEDPSLHAELAIAYAGLARRDDAIREGRQAVALRPPSKDTWLGVDMVRNLAVVYATLGEADSAVTQLRYLLTVPSWISLPALKADPTWDPIRRDPEFRKLVAGGG